MKTSNLLRTLFAVTAALWFASCDGGGGGGSDGGGSSDVGSNDVNKVLCLGDSITHGGCAPAGAPYPSRLAGLTGKGVINAGVCGERSAATRSRAATLFDRHKPGYLCLLIGANDASFGYSPITVGENIRAIIQEAKIRKIIPIVATLTPTVGPHFYSNDDAFNISAQIRVVAKEEGAKLVDLQKEFGSGAAALLQEDGLHPNDAGNQVVAAAFNDKI